MSHSIDVSTVYIKYGTCLFKLYIHTFSLQVHSMGLIQLSGLSRLSGSFGRDGPIPLNRDTTVLMTE